MSARDEAIDMCKAQILYLESLRADAVRRGDMGQVGIIDADLADVRNFLASIEAMP